VSLMREKRRKLARRRGSERGGEAIAVSALRRPRPIHGATGEAEGESEQLRKGSRRNPISEKLERKAVPKKAGEIAVSILVRARERSKSLTCLKVSRRRTNVAGGRLAKRF